MRILVTGSSGLIGTSLIEELVRRGIDVVGYDKRAGGRSGGDILDTAKLELSMSLCTGVIHLAAVSRVVHGERDPKGCWETNVGGTHGVVKAAVSQQHRPWVIFASSREVYGQQDDLPVGEDALMRPMNIYAQSKVAGEHLTLVGRRLGLRTSVIRLSNVYGNSTSDHLDRVVPAFARSAAVGSTMRVEGSGSTCDFTHVDDVGPALANVAEILAGGERALPPIHLVSGVATSLGELAEMAASHSRGTRSPIEEVAPRSYDVSRFVGNPGRASELLGWESSISITEGLARLVSDFRAQGVDRATTNRSISKQVGTLARRRVGESDLPSGNRA